MSEAFNEPNLTLSRIYTRGGDEGKTSLVGGQRVAKDSLRIECYGTVDELNAYIGLALLTAGQEPRVRDLAVILERVQHELFNLGSLLATLPQDLHPQQPRITNRDVVQLEHEIDRMNSELPELKSFVLPGGSRLNAELHVCRTVCRRVERLLVSLAHREEVDPAALAYLNRLSDALFVWSRWVQLRMNQPEVLWSPNRAAGAAPKEG